MVQRVNDIYLYEDVPVLKNKLGIKDEKTLDLVEAEQSRANMMLLYEHGFHDFSNRGIKRIHRKLFGDIYEWAGQYRVINISKREELLAGRSVWYANAEDISRDLQAAWRSIYAVDWDSLSREEFAREVAHKFPPLWQAHPFREGNTRTTVMLITFFVEHHRYYFDQELLAASAGYVRNSLVLASLGQYSEFEYLERILQDAICTEPIEPEPENETEPTPRSEKYKKYQTEHYTPRPHEYTEPR